MATKKKTETFYDIAKKEGMTSPRALAAKAKEMIPVVEFAQEIKIARTKATERGTSAAQEFLQRRQEQLQWGLGKATGIISTGGKNLVDENESTRKIKEQYDTTKDQLDQLKNVDMSKPIPVKASTPVRKGKPYVKKAHTRSKPRR